MKLGVGVRPPGSGEEEEVEGSLLAPTQPWDPPAPPEPRQRLRPWGLSVPNYLPGQNQEEIWTAFGCDLHFALISFYKYEQCPSPE